MATEAELLHLAAEIDRHLRLVRKMLRRPVEVEAARAGLTGPQRGRMHALASAPEGLNLKELSCRLGLAHSTVSGVVDRLERRGLLVRERGTEDRRSTRIAISGPVRAFVQEQAPLLRQSPLARALGAAEPAQRA